MTLSPGAFNKAMDDIFSEKAMDDMFKIDQKDYIGIGAHDPPPKKKKKKNKYSMKHQGLYGSNPNHIYGNHYNADVIWTHPKGKGKVYCGNCTAS